MDKKRDPKKSWKLFSSLLSSLSLRIDKSKRREGERAKELLESGGRRRGETFQLEEGGEGIASGIVSHRSDFPNSVVL